MPYPPVGQRHTGAPGTVIRAVTCALPQPLNRALSGNRRPRGVARLEALVIDSAPKGVHRGGKPDLASARGWFCCPCFLLLAKAERPCERWTRLKIFSNRLEGVTTTDIF